jgi:hypothetical protein
MPTLDPVNQLKASIRPTKTWISSRLDKTLKDNTVDLNMKSSRELFKT